MKNLSELEIKYQAYKKINEKKPDNRYKKIKHNLFSPKNSKTQNNNKKRVCIQYSVSFGLFSNKNNRPQKKIEKKIHI